ncbi:lipase/acyltransferase domain-containing protein [Melittangium boletus]|uniref:Lecithin:cholesterol acyltransferase n=1 Tax=Melittangium boletus DSM 14713 TaxID=1294270 RepID=A0A250IH03_9BACT|nr:hypothetical protein [Melittangium boletus]ATB30500.1 hypothetical protein MEBOL_003961 [Melittangium boletus DSM 14713]
MNVAHSSGNTATLLVPGYRGSFLVTEGPKPERAWITAGQALLRGHRSIALPFPGRRPEPTYGPLRPDGPMTRVGVLFASVDAYGACMRFGAERFPELVPFGYDWRQDIRKSAGELRARIEQLVAEGGGKREVNIVAHSMGGLVTLYCLLHGGEGGAPWSGAKHVRRVAIVGTPFNGSAAAFDDLLLGTQTVRNRGLLTPEALFTFPAVFQLLPPRSDFLVDARGAPVKYDAFDPSVWREKGWGPFRDASLHEDESYRAQLGRMLQAHREIDEALRPRSPPPPPPFETLVVVGSGHPTPDLFQEKNGTLDVEHPVYGDGDGSVVTSRALPVLPMAYRRLDSKSEHVALMSDKKVLGAIERFFRGEAVGTAPV